MLKHILALCLLSVNVSAELPDSVTDRAISTNLEYLDIKVNKAQKDVNALASSTISTSTILGITNGGTGSATAVGARTNLGVPATDGTGATGTWPISITGNATYATDTSKVAKTGDTMTGQLTMAGSSIAITTDGQLSIAKGSYKTSFKAGVQTSDISYILPTSADAAGGRFLTIDSSNNLSWQEQSLAGDQSYYFSGQNSDIAGYYNMYSTYPLVNLVSTYTFTATGSDVGVGTFTTLSGFPSNPIIPTGTWDIHFHAKKTNITNKEVALYGKFYKRSSGGVLTYIGQSEVSSNLTSTISEYDIHFTTDTIMLDSGDRLVAVALYSTSGTGVDPTAEFYLGGLYFSNLALPAPSVSIANFIPYSGATNSLNMGSYNITATNFYGDGATLSGVIQSTATGTYPLSIGGNAATATNATTAASFSGSLSGDVTGTQGATVVGNDSHSHNQTTLSGVIQSSATGHYGIAVASADYAPGDNLGNHTATQDLDLDRSNIINIDRAGIGVYRTAWGTEEEVVRNEPTFELDVYGNAAIQKGSQLFATDIVAISSTAATLPNTVSVSIDCVSVGCGNSDPSGLVSDNGTFFRFYGDDGDSIIIQTAYSNNDVPVTATIIGAQGFIEKYAFNPTNIVTGVYEGTEASYCKLGSISPNETYGFNQCRTNDWTVTDSTYVYGNNSYSWGYQITNDEANGTVFGWTQSIKLTGPATAYIDVMKMQLFYIDSDAFKLGYNTDRMTIDYGGNPVVYVSTFNSMGLMVEPLTTSGSINVSGGFFKNGVELGGTGTGADNLGSHIATMTVTANYGITASTLTVSGSSFSVGGSTLVVANGRVRVGDASPTTKLGLKDGYFYLNDTDVAHGVTTALPTDVFGSIVPQSDTDGGLGITGINDTNADRALALYGYIGSADPTDSYAAIHLQGGKKNGTGLQALADAESVLRIRNYATELLTIKGNGRVGINTTTPGSTLHVVGDQTVSGAFTSLSSATIAGEILGTETLKLTKHSATMVDGLVMTNNSNGGHAIKWNVAQTDPVAAAIKSANDGGYGNYISFLTKDDAAASAGAAEERLRISAEGGLTASGPATFASSVTVRATADDLTGLQIINTNANGATTTSSGITLTATNSVGQIHSKIAAVEQGADSANSDLAFYTGEGTWATPTEKMRVMYSGNVGIGTTAPGAKLEVNGNIVSSGTINAQNGLCINNDCKTVWGAGTGDAVLASTQTFTGTNSFTSLSTHTFSGTIDIGYERLTWSGVASGVNLSCSSGKVILGGGCGADGTTVIQNNFPTNNYTWSCGFSATTNARAYAICARIKP